MTAGLSAAENRRIGRAMSDYSMLADGDTVLVAVSGGIDSLVLAWLLHNWRNKAPINYRLQAVHIDMMPAADGAGINACQTADRLESIGLSCVILPADLPRSTATETPATSTKDVCFHCARSRRKQLFEYARKHHYSTIALGHHRDDIVETFFLNLTCGGNISTMRPRQDLFSGRLSPDSSTGISSQKRNYRNQQTSWAAACKLQLSTFRTDPAYGDQGAAGPYL